jgi:hypothetical protein
MRIVPFSCVGLILAVLGTAAWLDRPADGCAAMPPLGRYVRISDETAIIVWEAEQQVEHFIRSATFETDAESIGFLVPTPSQPTLHEVDQGAFGWLATVTAPKIIRSPRTPQVETGCGCSSRGPTLSAPLAEPNDVRVLHEERVAGLDAAVLEADDPAALNDWLKEHEYPASPELTAWLEPYVAQQWKITAFKYAKQNESEAKLPSAAVRLTFRTDKPVYPYREPVPAEDGQPKPPPPSRLLRVYFVGPTRVQGELGDDAKPWPAKTAWAGKLQSFHIENLAPKLKLEDMANKKTWWLTEFEDESSPRPGAHDLYFSPAEKQEAVERPPVYAGHRSRGDAAMYLVAAGVLAVYGYGLRRRHKKP